jgi:hypothetical protein
MADLKERSFCLKFCLEFGKAASETHEMLKMAFSDNAKVLSTSEESEANRAEHQGHVGDLF